MTDAPKPLTPEEVTAVEEESRDCGSPDCDTYMRLCADWRRMRAALEELREEFPESPLVQRKCLIGLGRLDSTPLAAPVPKPKRP